MADAVTILQDILPIFEAVVNDAPLAAEVLKLVITPIKEGREPTADEWAQLDALAEQAHQNLQND